MERSLLAKRYSNLFTQSRVLKSTVGLVGSVCLAYLLKSQNNASNLPKQFDTESVFYELSDEDKIELKLKNRGSKYIEGPSIENLISLPRYKIALISVKQALKVKSRENYARVIDEISKLNAEKNKDPHINSGFMNQIRSLLNDELNFELALKAPHIDNDFFRNDPPSTIRKINKISRIKGDIDLDSGLIFEFYEHYAPEITQRYKKKSPIKAMITRLNSDIKSHKISEYFISDKLNVNVWSTDDGLNTYDFDEHSDYIKQDDLKRKFTSEFIKGTEQMIMTLVEELAKTNTKQFVEMNGLELLILLYEKHKFEEDYLTSIGNCLSHISLDPEMRRLFIQSGWLKRLNKMSKIVSNDPNRTEMQNGHVNLINQLISHKILFNLNQCMHKSPANDNKLRVPDIEPLYYSTKIYPLNVMDSDVIKKSSNAIDYNSELMKLVENHEHVVDVIFVHGLRGSLFRTWRQDDKKIVVPEMNEENSTRDSELAGLEASILERLNHLIEEIKPTEHYSNCWPRDWLSSDLDQEIPGTKFRLLGVNYESLFSSWEKEKFDDKAGIAGIKEHAMSLIEQLRQAHVGERPIIWVCHSMGGLIVKQMLVHLNEIERKMDRKKMTKRESKKYLDSSLVESTKGIVFCSTPHLGSSVAKAFSNFKYVILPSNELVELSYNSSYLVDLNKKFLDFLNTRSRPYDILSICENLPTFYFANVWAKTVTEESANIGVGEFYVALEKDHLNICKPDSRDSVIYKKIFKLITDPFVNSDCKNCKIELELIAKRNEKYLFQLFGHFSNF